MNERPATLFATVGALALVLSGCTAEPLPTPTPVVSTPAVESLSFADGATLSADTEISWGDGFAHDDGWREVEHLTEPGRWMYANTDETCVAAFRSGPLGEAGDMDDREATDAVIAATLGTELAEMDGTLGDGYFIRHGPGEAQVAHRQFSLTIDGRGRFIAARAFAELDYSVEVTVMCDAIDVSAVAEEVLSKNTLSVE